MLEFVLISLALELTPGPNMAYLTAYAFAQGRSRAMAGVAGTAVGLALVGIAASFGLAAFVDDNPVVYSALRYGGVCYLLWLAWQAWRDADAVQPNDGANWSSFQRMLVANLLNPKAAVFYITVLPSFVAPSSSGQLAQSLTLAAVYVAIATMVHTALVVFAAGIGATLANPQRRRLVARVLAVGLAGVAIWFLFKTAR